MAYEQKPGDAVLFRNKFKDPGDKKPDYKGNGLDLNGEKIEIAGWVKDGPNGKFMTLKIQRPQQKQDVPRSSNPASKYASDEPEQVPASELPF